MILLICKYQLISLMTFNCNGFIIGLRKLVELHVVAPKIMMTIRRNGSFTTGGGWAKAKTVAKIILTTR